MSHLELTGRDSLDPIPLLEREEPLAALRISLEQASRSGRLVSISGEAGIGKSSLLKAFERRESEARFMWGGCDALKTPSPLGPLQDMASDIGGLTRERLNAGAPPHELFAAFVEDVAKCGRPVVVIFEDVHWADEATLDLLKYAGRRIDRTRALLIITWRDDEVDVDHAIHRVLGSWNHDHTLRIRLQPLSLEAVEALADGSRNARELHTLTGGNPFFVTEVLNAGNETVPVTVRDAVLARRATLDVAARAVVDFASIVPSRAEFLLLDAALHPPPAAIEQCIAAGLLVSEPNAVTFRHELTRQAVASALPPPRTHSYHRMVVETLLEHFDRSAVLARIVHHAVACGATDAVVKYAPAAARQASALGAHCQALSHYRCALEHRERLSAEARAQLLESCAYEHYVTGDMQAACEARAEALELWTQLGFPEAIGRNMRWLSRVTWFAGDRSSAERWAVEAIDVLRALPESEELAMAYSNRAQLEMLLGNLDSSIEWGTLAIELARRVNSVDVLTHALNNVGTARATVDDHVGFMLLEESLDLALAHDLHEHAARAFTNLASREVSSRRYLLASAWLQRGIAYTSERDLDAWSFYMQAWRARMLAETGAWTEACAEATAVLNAPRTTPITRIAALAALGLVYTRRGNPAALETLNEALALARPTREMQRLVPILAVLAELAWLEGRLDDIVEFVREGIETAAMDGAERERERLYYWLWKAGAREAVISTGDGPYTLLMQGDYRAAAAFWLERGCPYEQAEALLEGDMASATAALEIFQTLGAAPAVERARQRLRLLGAGRMPRGRRATTRAHPAGLTSREVEILPMLALGLGNPQIAARLFVSRKTVEHHVSSILGKLEVPTREAAVARAKEEGWLDSEEPEASGESFASPASG